MPNLLAIRELDAIEFVETDRDVYQKSISASASDVEAYSNMAAKAEEEVPYLYSVLNGVGVVKMQGKLTNSDSFWNRIFGRTSYADLRDALVYAANDASVSQIMLDINSPGGEVNGMADVGQLVAQVNRVKPVTAFTDGMMASAAYYIGSHAKKIYSTDMATVGSIGVIMNLVTREKMMKSEGYTPHVIRAGKYKQIGNPNEELTTEGKAYLQSHVDYVYDKFIDVVAENRGVIPAVADKKMGQGRDFIGDQALEAGLVDKITTFDKVMSKLEEKEEFMSKKYSKTALTETQVAAIAAGASPEELDVQVEAETAPVEVEVEVEAEAEAEGASVDAEADGASVDADADAAMKAELETVQAELTAAQEANVAMAAELEAIKTAQVAELVSLKKIAAGAIEKMRVALSLTPVDMSAYAAETLIAEHKAVTESFTKAFKVGGSASSSVEDESKPKATVTKLHTAKVGAVGF